MIDLSYGGFFIIYDRISENEASDIDGMKEQLYAQMMGWC